MIGVRKARTWKCLQLLLLHFTLCCTCSTRVVDPAGAIMAELWTIQHNECNQVEPGSSLSKDPKTQSITHARWKHQNALTTTTLANYLKRHREESSRVEKMRIIESLSKATETKSLGISVPTCEPLENAIRFVSKLFASMQQYSGKMTICFVFASRQTITICKFVIQAGFIFSESRNEEVRVHDMSTNMRVNAVVLCGAYIALDWGVLNLPKHAFILKKYCQRI